MVSRVAAEAGPELGPGAAVDVVAEVGVALSGCFDYPLMAWISPVRSAAAQLASSVLRACRVAYRSLMHQAVLHQDG